MYLFGDDDLTRNQFFRFNKKMVLNMTWAFLPLSAKAVLPVIFSHANRQGQAWPSEETISALSGVSPKTVRKGINKLLTLPGFSFNWQMTAQGRKSKKFKLPIPSKDDKVFFFHKLLLTGGNWRMLKPVGKAVYPVLRTFSAWDREEALDEDVDIEITDNEDFKEAYRVRKWEYTELLPGDIAHYAGIARQQAAGALRDLEQHDLAEKAGDRWKVYLIPPQHYKRAFLNEQLIKSFAHKRNGDE